MTPPNHCSTDASTTTAAAIWSHATIIGTSTRSRSVLCCRQVLLPMSLPALLCGTFPAKVGNGLWLPDVTFVVMVRLALAFVLVSKLMPLVLRLGDITLIKTAVAAISLVMYASSRARLRKPASVETLLLLLNSLPSVSTIQIVVALLLLLLLLLCMCWPPLDISLRLNSPAVPSSSVLACVPIVRRRLRRRRTTVRPGTRTTASTPSLVLLNVFAALSMARMIRCPLHLVCGRNEK